jgi:hypothetical protein
MHIVVRKRTGSHIAVADQGSSKVPDCRLYSGMRSPGITVKKHKGKDCDFSIEYGGRRRGDVESHQPCVDTGTRRRTVGGTVVFGVGNSVCLVMSGLTSASHLTLFLYPLQVT